MQIKWHNREPCQASVHPAPARAYPQHECEPHTRAFQDEVNPLTDVRYWFHLVVREDTTSSSTLELPSNLILRNRNARPSQEVRPTLNSNAIHLHICLFPFSRHLKTRVFHEEVMESDYDVTSVGSAQHFRPKGNCYVDSTEYSCFFPISDTAQMLLDVKLYIDI